MAYTRGFWNEDGYLVKADSAGLPWMEQQTILPKFRQENITTLPDILAYGARTFGDYY